MHPQIGAFIERRNLRSKKTLAHKRFFSSISSPFVFFRMFLLLEFFIRKKFFDKTYKKEGSEKYTMVRNLENSMSDNSNIQDMGPRRSTRLNVALGEMVPLPRGSTMGTTAVTTRGEVHGTATTTQVVLPRQTQVVPSKVHATKAMAQASHSRASRTEQPAPAAQPAYAARPAPVVSQAANQSNRAVGRCAISTGPPR